MFRKKRIPDRRLEPATPVPGKDWTDTVKFRGRQ